METVELIIGFTRLQMVYYFFDRHKEGVYSTWNITDYIYRNFDLPKNKTFIQLNNEVSSELSKCYDEKLNREANFFRFRDSYFCGKKYLYEYTPNSFVVIPPTFRVEFPDIREKIEIAPRQQTYKKIKVDPKPEQLEILFDDTSLPIEENQEAEELSPLMQDIKNAETLLPPEEIPSITSFEALFNLLKPKESINIKMNEDNSITFTKKMEA